MKTVCVLATGGAADGFNHYSMGVYTLLRGSSPKFVYTPGCGQVFQKRAAGFAQFMPLEHVS